MRAHDQKGSHHEARVVPFRSTRMSRIRMLLAATFMLIGSASAEPPKADTSDLIGAWQLISVETIGARGEITYPFYGRKPQGLLIYDPSGWMSIQIVSDPKPIVPKDDTR